MSGAINRLKRALSAVANAQRAMRRAYHDANKAGVDTTNMRRAIRELEDAEARIKWAMREIDN